MYTRLFIRTKAYFTTMPTVNTYIVFAPPIHVVMGPSIFSHQSRNFGLNVGLLDQNARNTV